VTARPLNLVNLMAGAGTTANANGASIENINIFNSALLGTDDASNPIAIFSFDTSGTDAELSYSAERRHLGLPRRRHLHPTRSSSQRHGHQRPRRRPRPGCRGRPRPRWPRRRPSSPLIRLTIEI
jgi:hypothetical protein